MATLNLSEACRVADWSVVAEAAWLYGQVRLCGVLVPINFSPDFSFFRYHFTSLVSTKQTSTTGFVMQAARFKLATGSRYWNKSLRIFVFGSSMTRQAIIDRQLFLTIIAQTLTCFSKNLEAQEACRNGITPRIQNHSTKISFLSLMCRI